MIDNEHNPTDSTNILSRIAPPNYNPINLYDVAPTIIGVGQNATISITPETKTSTTTRDNIIV